MSLQQQIHDTLQAALQPEHLEVLNESHMHSRGGDSHFKVVLVSPIFTGLSAVRRHQRVYVGLGALMEQFHALAVHTYTPDEWRARMGVPDSPACAGGSQHMH